jgi:hypothetical protein
MPTVTRTITPRPVVLRGKVFALLADNQLMAINVRDGAVMAQYSVAPPPSPDAGRSTGHYMAPSKDGKRLFILAPGEAGKADNVAVVDAQTAKLLASHSLHDSGDVFRALAIGPSTGRIYLFGDRSGAAIVTVMDPDSGTTLANWIARTADGYDWFPYEGAVSFDERVLYISYHGVDTTGIDRFLISDGGLQRCPPSNRPNVGCIGGHGGFLLYGNSIVTGDGGGLMFKEDMNGTIRSAFDTGLAGNHLMEFVVDRQTNRLYAVGSCGYSGGVSANDLTAGGTYTLTEFGVIKWLVSPAPPVILAAPQPRRPVKTVPCGQRLALGPDSWLAVGVTARPVPDVSRPGALAILNALTGEVLRTNKTPSEPVDVIVVADA